MDANSNANTINPAASGQSIPCTSCGTINKPDCNFCITCGAKLTIPTPAVNSDIPVQVNDAAPKAEAAPAPQTVSEEKPAADSNNAAPAFGQISDAAPETAPASQTVSEEKPAADSNNAAPAFGQISDAASETAPAPQTVSEEKPAADSNNAAPAFGQISDTSKQEKTTDSTAKSDSVNSNNAAPAFGQISDTALKTDNSKKSSDTAGAVAEEPKDAFAQGLPAWSIEPPQMVVKRRG